MPAVRRTRPPRVHDGPHRRHRAPSCATTTSPRTPCAWPAPCTSCARTTPRRPACSRWSLLTEARAAGRRLGADGAQVLLADADRSRWDADADRRGPGAPRRPPPAPAPVPLLPAGGDRRRPRPGAVVRGHRLGADRAPLRRPAARRAEPDGRHRPLRGAVVPRSVRRPGWPTSTRCSPSAGSSGYPYAHAARAQLLERLGRAGRGRRGLGRGGRRAPAPTPSGRGSRSVVGDAPPCRPLGNLSRRGHN